jgi:hypothetical protein
MFNLFRSALSFLKKNKIERLAIILWQIFFFPESGSSYAPPVSMVALTIPCRLKRKKKAILSKVIKPSLDQVRMG